MRARKLGSLLAFGLLSAGLSACVAGDELGTGGAAVTAPAQRYIVAYRSQAGRAAAHAAGVVHRDLGHLHAIAATLPQAAVEALRHNPAIEYVEVDALRFPLAETTPYGIDMVQASMLSDAAAGNRTVCIIDSGYNLGHEDLSAGANVTGTDDLGGAGPWSQDGSGHGTHVAGTISALNNDLGVVGVLPNSTINLHIVRVFGDDGTWAYSSDLVTALQKCEAADANVVSMSLGGGKSKTEERAFAAANSRGVLSIAAAGNDGDTSISYPAGYASVVSVAAIDQTGTVAAFSQQNADVELAAPGVDVLSTVPMGAGLAATLVVGGVDYAAAPMEYAPIGTATGALIDCGLGDSACTAAAGGICLIQRGVISFADKVNNCAAGGGLGAIIYNNEPGMLYATLGALGTIPAVGASGEDGPALLARLGQTATVTLTAASYEYYNGTSMATPHVSGVAALVWSYDPSWTNQQIRDALAATAIDLGAAGRDIAYGYGLVQAAAALDYLQGGPSCDITEAPEVSCSDGLDNDCDGDTDGADADCGGSTCLPAGAVCTSNGECCSSSCKGKPGAKLCR